MKNSFELNCLRTAVTVAMITLTQTLWAAAVTPSGNLSAWACTGVCGTSAADGDIGLSPLANSQYGYLSTFGSTEFGVSPLALVPNGRGSGVEHNGSKIVSGAFHATAGDQLDLRFNYISTDGKGFDDYAWARLLNASDNSLVAWLYTARSTNSDTKNVVPGGVVDKLAFDPKAVIVDYASFNFHSKTVNDPVNWSLLGSSNGTCWRNNAAGCGFTDWLHSQVSFAADGDYRVEIGIVNWGDKFFDSGLAFDFTGLNAAPVPEPASLSLTLLGLGVFGLAAVRRRRIN